MAIKPLFSHPLLQSMSQSAFKLAAFVLICIVLLLVVRVITAPSIADAERNQMLMTMNQVLPESLYDNDLLGDILVMSDRRVNEQLGNHESTTFYRARKQNQPAGVIFQVTAPNGYSGEIVLLVAVKADYSIAGVRVLKHRETPGLGDKIDIRKDDWIRSFDDLTITIDNAIQRDTRWAVKKDGGQFDQFTGATITPRAVIKAVHNAVQVCQSLGDRLYE